MLYFLACLELKQFSANHLIHSVGRVKVVPSAGGWGWGSSGIQMGSWMHICWIPVVQLSNIIYQWNCIRANEHVGGMCLLIVVMWSVVRPVPPKFDTIIM